MIATTFKLTPMELRMLLAIVEVGGAPEVAEALGVAPSTVSRHLKRLYAKTGASRQVDLVKLVAKFASPFAQLIRRQVFFAISPDRGKRGLLPCAYIAPDTGTRASPQGPRASAA